MDLLLELLLELLLVLLVLDVYHHVHLGWRKAPP